MDKQSVSRFVKGVGNWTSKRSPEILTGIGIAGMITTTVLAVKATPKALQLIEEEKERKSDELHRERYKELEKYTVEEFLEDAKLTPLEVVKAAWKPYIPAIVTGTVSVVCLIGASSVSLRRNAALATAYKLSETALNEFKDKAVEVVGEKKVKEIKEGISEDKIKKNPVSNSEVIVTEKGNTLCYESVSGRYFRSDMEKIRRAVNELNRRMISENYISLTEFYNEIGLPPTKISDRLGWNISVGLIELDFSSHLADDGTPCIAVDYLYAPSYDFDRYY